MTDQPIPLFQGEAMLLSWGDTSSRGKTVTFALHPDECGDAHPFRDLGTGKHGQRFKIVAVPIDDEDQPLSSGASNVEPAAEQGAVGDKRMPPPPRVAPGETKGGWYALKPSARASILVKDDDFQNWVSHQSPFSTGGPSVDEQTDGWLKAQIDTHSKACLNPENKPHHAAALKKFLVIERAYRVARGLETEAR